MNKNITPVCLPKLPLAEHIIPYLQQIDKNRWYTNYGPLAREFMSRMANLFQLKESQLISCVNGTVMLELCLKAMDIPKDSICIMPSWTFVATPLSAVNANLKPYFVDVDKITQTIDRKKLEDEIPKISRHGKIGAVIVVTPFGLPVNVKEWDDFTERTGIPVLIDAAPAFDTVLQVPDMHPGNTPMMISLHATKVLGVGEAAILLSKNENLINKIECLTQFGFPKGIRNAEFYGTNAKISEYVSAVGLAALDIWPSTRSEWEEINDCYQDNLYREDIPIFDTLHRQWVTSTCNVFLPNSCEKLALKLEEMGFITRKWYGYGCHKQAVFRNALSSALPNTEYLANSILGLPFYIGMTGLAIKQITHCVIEFCRENGNKIFHLKDIA